MDGHANFLQQPHVSFKGEVDLRYMDLAYYSLFVKGVVGTDKVDIYAAYLTPEDFSIARGK